MFWWKHLLLSIYTQKVLDDGDFQLWASFYTLVSFPPFQTLALRKPAKSQPLPGAAQYHTYRLYKAW